MLGDILAVRENSSWTLPNVSRQTAPRCSIILAIRSDFHETSYGLCSCIDWGVDFVTGWLSNR